jgi:hypothetical protein
MRRYRGLATGRCCVEMDIEATACTLLEAVEEVSPDIEQNRGCIAHEGERDRQDERVNMGFVESPLTQEAQALLEQLS